MKRHVPGRQSRPVCSSGKIRYRDEVEAQLVIANARRMDESRVRPCRAYFCDVCGGAHLTSQAARA